MNSLPPLILINAVGLTSRWLSLAPRLHQLAQSGWCRAVGRSDSRRHLHGPGHPAHRPTRRSEHGIVGNGWLFRDTGEVRFWQQSNRLLQAEPLYATARRLARRTGPSFRCAKLFWWFNQGAAVDISVTPKPYYGADGNKVFGIPGTPDGLTERLERELGPFPFHTFWGPMAGLPCTEWIARGRRGAATRTARPDAGLPATPRLRSAALRPRKLRLAATGRRAGRRLCARCSTRPEASAPASGS